MISILCDKLPNGYFYFLLPCCFIDYVQYVFMKMGYVCGRKRDGKREEARRESQSQRVRERGKGRGGEKEGDERESEVTNTVRYVP